MYVHTYIHITHTPTHTHTLKQIYITTRKQYPNRSRVSFCVKSEG